MKTSHRPLVTLFAVLIVVSGFLTPAAFAAQDQPTSPAAAFVERGVAALARSEFIPAENEFRQAIATDPNYALAYSWTGELFALQPGREKEALDACRKGVELAPQDGRVLALLADVTLMDDPQAVASAEKAATLAPKDALVQAILAEAYVREAQWQKAQAAAQAAVKLDPKLARGYYALGVVYGATADRARSEAAFREAIKIEPKNVRLHMKLAALLGADADEGPALREYDAVTKIAPNYLPALLEAARLYHERGMVQSGRDKLAAAVKLAPNVWLTRSAQGAMAAAEGDYSAAQSHYQRALALAPNNLEVIQGLASTKTSAGDCAAAKDLLEKQLDRFPRAWGVHYELSYAYACLEDFKKSMSAAEKAVELNPYSDWALASLAVSQDGGGETDDALQSYGRAATVTTTPEVFLTYAAQLLLNANRLDEAEEAYKTASRLGGGPDADLGLCISQVSQEKAEEAVAACAAAHEADMQNPTITRMYGVALAASGQASKAVQMLQLAIHDDPDDNAYAHQWLAIAYMKSRKFKEALAEYETYLKLSDEQDQATEQIVALLKQGYPLKDVAVISQLTQAAPKLLTASLKAQITGKTAADRTLTITLTASAQEAADQMVRDTIVGMGLAAHFGSRLDPAVTGASVRMLDGKGKLFMGMTGDLNALQDASLGLISNQTALSHYKIESAAPVKQGAAADDIRQIGKDVAGVRGLQERKPISVTLISQTEFTKGYEAAASEEMVGQQAQNEALFRLLGGLGPRDNLKSLTNDLLNEQVLGYYDSGTEALKVLKDKTPDAIQRLTVAHEYVHALQDQNFTMLDDKQTNGDADMAVRAVVEGDASLASQEFATKSMAAQELIQFFGDLQSELDQEALDAAPVFLSEIFSFPYTEGQAFVKTAFDRSGWKGVNDLYAKPPQSTEQILHPERYRSGEAPVKITMPKVASALGGDWAVAEEDTVGEIGWRALLQAHIGKTFASQAADGWGGDRYTLLKNKAGEYSLAIRSEWDAAADADQFAALLRLTLNSRDGYKEVTSDLLAANPVRVWQGGADWWAVKSDGKRVQMGIAKTRELAEKIVAALDK